MKDDGKTFWKSVGLTSTKDKDIITPTTLNTATRNGTSTPNTTGDTDVDAYLRQMQESTARAVEDKREGVDEVDYGKLFVGTARKGINQLAGSLTSTADWLIGQPLQAIGWENNPVSELNREMKNEAALLSFIYDENAAKSVPARLINKYGPSVVAALPQAVLAYFTVGSSLAAQSSTKGLQLISNAAQNGGLLSTIANAAKTMMSDLQFWLPVAQTAGLSYEQARMDGADDFHASVYATVNSLLNGLIERGGGGIQDLPEQLRGGNPSLVRSWVFSTLNEGKEELVQGIVSRLMQNITYGKGNPMFSTTDRNAVFNPITMAEDAAGGLFVGGTLGSGQMIANNVAQNWNTRQNGGKNNASSEITANSHRLLYMDRLLDYAKRDGNLYTQRILQAEVEKTRNNFGKAEAETNILIPTIYADYINAHKLVNGKENNYHTIEDVVKGLLKVGRVEANGRFLNKNEKLYQYAEKIHIMEGYEDFTCHADENMFYIDCKGNGNEGDFVTLSPEEYAEAIKNSNSYNGGNIRIISCQAGALEDGAAQRLADALNVMVYAPTETVNVDENGNMFVTNNDILAELWYNANEIERARFKETGQWVLFMPRKGDANDDNSW